MMTVASSISLSFTIITCVVEIVNKHCQGVACTRQFDMGLTSPQKPKAKVFYMNNIFILPGACTIKLFMAVLDAVS
jgi:hypothetical protein